MVQPPSLAVPRFLYEQGTPHILAPLPTLTEALWVDVGDFAVSVYPFLDARTAEEAGLSDDRWHALGATLRRMPTSQLPAPIQPTVPRETFVPSRRDVLTRLEAVMANPAPTDPSHYALSVFWRTRQAEIRTLTDRADALGNQLRGASLSHGPCHADLHAWNVLLDARQHLWIVDWDETVLAPKERDLMFVIGGIAETLVSPHQTACFLRGYGEAVIDHRALTYYRYAWAAQEMAAYAEAVFFAPDLSAQARGDSTRAFIGLFDPGNIVVIARASEAGVLRGEVGV